MVTVGEDSRIAAKQARFDTPDREETILISLGADLMVAIVSKFPCISGLLTNSWDYLRQDSQDSLDCRILSKEILKIMIILSNHSPLFDNKPDKQGSFWVSIKSAVLRAGGAGFSRMEESARKKLKKNLKHWTLSEFWTARQP